MEAKYALDTQSIELAPNVLSQLQDMVTTLVLLFHGNPFHNYDHACHVTMSANKLLSRITTPGTEGTLDDSGRGVHQYIYGLTSDPLTQFAIVFSAMIHDLDHQGLIPMASCV
jgi:hypothetical protein